MRSLFVLLALTPILLGAQTNIRVMSYNLLNFPEPVPAGRADTLRNILRHHPVDLLIVQELRSAEGHAQILARSLNDGSGRFSAVPHVPPVSAPWLTDHRLGQALFYDHRKLGFKRQAQVTTNVRDINVYDLYFRTPGNAHGDTLFLTVYALHLKAGTTSNDIQSRVTMINALRGHMAGLPAGRAVIVAGDMNVYTGTEPSLVQAVQPAGNTTLQDPLDLVGSDWTGGGPFASVYTQSTRTSQIHGDGASGGIDDRFDIALLSENLFSGQAPVRYVAGSYRALGNNGSCYDRRITDCNTTQQHPRNLLTSLYHMSDHLPVVFNLLIDEAVGIAPVHAPTLSVRTMGGGNYVVDLPNSTLHTCTVIDASGRILHSATKQQGPWKLTLPTPGLYILHVYDGAQLRTARVVGGL